MNKLTRKLTKKTLLSIIALVLGISMTAGCSGTQTPSSGTSAVTTSSSSASSEEASQKGLYPFGNGDVTLTWLTIASGAPELGFEKPDDLPYVKYWEEKTGINVDFKVVADFPAMCLYFASGEYPDLFTMYENGYKGGNTQMVADKLAINLLDYKDYMPDYLATLEINDLYKKAVTAPDGNIYMFSNFMEKGTTSLSWRGMVLRQDFLDKLNMSLPTTNDEFYNMLVAFRDKLGCDAPLMCNWWANMFDDGFFTTQYGLVTANAYQVDGKYHYGAYENQYRDALAYMNKLYSEGLFDVNFQTTDEPTSQASLLNGETGAHYTSCARINNITKKSTDEKFALVGIGSLNGSDGKKAMFSQSDSLTPTRDNAYITADCSNKEAAVALLNWFYTEEGRVAANYGIENVNWTMDSNGTRVFTKYMTTNETLSLDSMLGSLFRGGPTLGMAAREEQRFAMEAQKEASRRWNTSDFSTYQLPVYKITAEEKTNRATELWTDLSTYINESRVKFITGEYNLTNDFDKYLATLKQMNMDEYISIQQEALDAYYK